MDYRLAFYQFGHSIQLFVARSEDCWFAAQPESPFPSVLGNLLAEARIQIGATGILTLPDTEYAALTRVQTAAETANEHLQRCWCSAMHRNVLSGLDQLAETPEHPREEWWDSSSPLSADSYRSLCAALVEALEFLSPLRSRWLQTGRLVAQIDDLDQWDQSPLRGDRYPIPSLRVQFIELAHELSFLAQAGCDLPVSSSDVPGTLAIEYTKHLVRQIHTRILSELAVGEQTATLQLIEHHEPDVAPSQSTPAIRTPSRRQLSAWFLRHNEGLPQNQIADRIAEQFGCSRPSQGSISRWLSAVDDFLLQRRAQVAQPRRATNREVPMDPATLDMGMRQDLRRPRPSDMPDGD